MAQPYRTPPSVWIATVIALAIFLAAAIASFYVPVPGWTRFAFVGAVFLGVGALIEIALARVELSDSGLTMVRGFRRRFVAREEIESVTWEKGGGVAIRLVGGTWVKLPAVGRTLPGLANGIRAWLNRTDHGSEHQRTPMFSP